MEVNKMKISELGIERKFNLGNYEHIIISVKVVPEKMDVEGEYDEAFEEMVCRIDKKAEKVREKISDGWFEDEEVG